MGGRHRSGDEALTAIIFVAASGGTWRQRPPVFGPGSASRARVPSPPSGWSATAGWWRAVPWGGHGAARTADTGPPAVPGAGGRGRGGVGTAQFRASDSVTYSRGAGEGVESWIGKGDGRRHAGRGRLPPCTQPRRRSTQVWELRRGRPACRDDPHVTPSASVPGSVGSRSGEVLLHALLAAVADEVSKVTSAPVEVLRERQHRSWGRARHPQPGAGAPRRKRSTARRPRAQLGPFPGTAPRGGSSRQAAIAPGAFPRGAATSSPGPRQARCPSTSHPLPASRGREPRRPVRGPGGGRPRDAAGGAPVGTVGGPVRPVRGQLFSGSGSGSGTSPGGSASASGRNRPMSTL